MLLPKEVWKEIPGWEGYYMASTHGRIKSVDRYVISNGRGKYFKKGKILRLETDKDGYKKIQLNKNGKAKKYLVHRLVAMCFIPNPNNLPEINHKDENRANNHVSNLEWCNRKYNCNYGTRNEKVSNSLKGKITWNKGKNNTHTISVTILTEQGEFIKRFNSMNDAYEFLINNNILDITITVNNIQLKDKLKQEEAQ